VALNATGNIGTNAGSRLATAAGTLAAHGANVFIAETDAVTLNTVNSVANSVTAGNAYDRSDNGGQHHRRWQCIGTWRRHGDACCGWRRERSGWGWTHLDGQRLGKPERCGDWRGSGKSGAD